MSSPRASVAVNKRVRAVKKTASRASPEVELAVVRAEGPDLDRSILRLAQIQHEVVSRGQLTRLGLSRDAVTHRLRSGRLHRVHHGIFAAGRPGLTVRGRQLAAVMAYGPKAVLSHRSAGALWELLTTSQGLVDVTVPGTSRRPQKQIRIHRARELADEDLAVVDGIPVTSVARTLLDLAGVLNAGELVKAVEQAERSGRLDLAALGRLLGRSSRHPGARKLRRILADYAEPMPVRSELERRFLELVLGAGLPRPRVNTKVAGLEVDFFWPQWRLVVELDGRAYHSDPRSFERDRVRDARLQRHRCRVLRVTHKRMTGSAREVLADIRALAALADAA